MNELSLFTGAGGGVLGTHLLGWTPVGYVEYDDYCQRIIRQRINDGIIPNAPIFGDIRTFISDGYTASYQGMVDVITGGFPCQPFSEAGKQLEANDPRNMWPATASIISTIRPQYVLLENVTGLVTGGYFGTVVGDLAACGYDCRWRVLSAAEVGGTHKRDRVWIIAYPRSDGNNQHVGKRRVQNKRTISDGLPHLRHPQEWCKAWEQVELDFGRVAPEKWRHEGYGIDSEPFLLRNDDGVAHRLDRLKAIGNGQVPAVAATAWEMLTNDLI